MGRMAGFHFRENFRTPYIASSMKDFWRRWHISLSSWFRDYLYIPLGGNRRGRARTYLNLVIVFFVTRLWHGASFNFVVWGLFHGAFLCLERIKNGAWVERFPRPLRYIYTMLVVVIGWVFFRADTLRDALVVIGTMFSPVTWSWRAVLPVLNLEFIFFFVAAILFSGDPFMRGDKRSEAEMPLILIWPVFFIAVLYVVGSDFNPFIYFRF